MWRMLLVSATASVAGWGRWRGANGTGVVNEPQEPLEWSAKQNVAWRVPLPEPGNSTPVVWGDQLFVTQARKGCRRATSAELDR
jgi:outer membrane protein assembly factor BamB